MIIDEIKKANIELMKAHDQVGRAVISVILNKYKLTEIENTAAGKETSDADVVKIITKAIKELDEEAEGYKKVNRLDEVNNISHQKELLVKYLPKMLSEEEIRKIIDSLADKSMPSIMRHFKANYDGQVDMSLVSKIARTL